MFATSMVDALETEILISWPLDHLTKKFPKSRPPASGNDNA